VTAAITVIVIAVITGSLGIPIIEKIINTIVAVRIVIIIVTVRTIIIDRTTIITITEKIITARIVITRIRITTIAKGRMITSVPNMAAGITAPTGMTM